MIRHDDPTVNPNNLCVYYCLSPREPSRAIAWSGSRFKFDYVQAYAWMLLANESQNSQIKDLLFKISEKLTEYQIIEARTLADKWYEEQHRLTTASE